MDAYARAWSLQRRRARRAEPAGARALRALLALAVVAALVPLLRGVFLSFLDAPPDAWGPGLAGALTRAALVVLVVVSLAVHATVLRGPSRAVVQIHPVDPRAVVREELRAAALARGPVVLAVLAVLLPVAVEVGVGAWALAALVVLGTAAAALTLSAVVFLGAVEAAESEAWAPWLDLLRGNNPRPQAAIIWALAPSTLLAGGLAIGASAGAVQVLAGEPVGWAWVLAPWVLAAASAPWVPRLADRAWFRASVVLADIQARYATVEQAEEARRVYLDWTVRWLPAEAARWALLDLRYGWRVRRSWLSALWLVAVGAFVAGWSDDPAAPRAAGLVAGLGAFLAGAVPVLAAQEEPAFLRGWLPRSAGSRGLARAWVVAAWAVAPVAAGAASAWLRQGGAGLGGALGLGAGLALAAAAASAAWAAWRERGMAPYVGTAALVLAGASALWLGGGA